MTAQDRFVEVLADRGPGASPRWRPSSGLLLGGGLVLTSAHGVVDGELSVRRIGGVPGTRGIGVARKEEWPAKLRLLGDVDTADLALLTVDEALGPSDRIRFARIDRYTSTVTVVEGCSAVGFPKFMRRDETLNSARETAQVDGVIPTSQNLGSGLLTLLVTQRPRELPADNESLGRSPWSGMSGAAATVGGLVVGVVSEHAPRQGSSALTLVPITFIDLLPDAAQWWSLLQADPARLPLLPAPERRLLGPVPEIPAHYQERSCANVLAQAMEGCAPVLLSPERAGLGGVGKSLLAAGYARRMWERKELDVVLWIEADRRETVIDGFRAAAAEMGIESLPHWLAATEQRWLIVLDDLTDAEVLTGLVPVDRANGRVLITTRDFAVPGGELQACRVEVGPFDRAEAISYLTACLGCSSREAEELALALRLQPLALAEATAYMWRHGLDCAQYMRRFGDRHRLLPRMLLGVEAANDLLRSTVAVAWSLGVEASTPQGGGEQGTSYEVTTPKGTLRLSNGDDATVREMLLASMRLLFEGDADG